eukprot:jgi/Orpsp1_1/1182224/evm.model.c7180000080406.1
MSFDKPAQVQLPVSTSSVDTAELMKNCQQGSSLETLLASLFSAVTNLDNGLKEMRGEVNQKFAMLENMDEHIKAVAAGEFLKLGNKLEELEQASEASIEEINDQKKFLLNEQNELERQRAELESVRHTVNNQDIELANHQEQLASQINDDHNELERLRQRLAELESRNTQPMFENMSVYQTQQSMSELELPSSSRSEIKGKKPSVGLSLTRSDLRNSRSTEYDSEGDVIMKDKPLPPDLEFPDFDGEVEDVEYFAKRCRLQFKTQPQYFEDNE